MSVYIVCGRFANRRFTLLQVFWLTAIELNSKKRKNRKSVVVGGACMRLRHSVYQCPLRHPPFHQMGLAIHETSKTTKGRTSLHHHASSCSTYCFMHVINEIKNKSRLKRWKVESKAVYYNMPRTRTGVDFPLSTRALRPSSCQLDGEDYN